VRRPEFLLIGIGVVVAAFMVTRGRTPTEEEPLWPPTPHAVQQALLDELKPVSLKNCTLKRYGSPHDGGYLMCANLLKDVKAAYSYGIDFEDNWGCDVSREFGMSVHQYDCFTNERPACSGGRFVFHDECVGPRRETLDGQPFDTLAAQIERNGDTGNALLVKIDVEGAEWESLLATPDAVLDTFVQMPMEVHLWGLADESGFVTLVRRLNNEFSLGLVDEPRFLTLVRRLKDKFYLVNLHFNNFACTGDNEPLPSRAFQTLWVNKRVGILDPGAPSPAPPSPLNAADDPNAPECRSRMR
jgi:hypothetical protein